MIYSDYFKMEKVSAKLMNIWFDFRQVLNKAGVQMDVLDFVHNTVKELNIEVGNKFWLVVFFLKKITLLL